ncbi:MAG TPA: phosphate ABC transporter permease subunit PstC, partial [Methylotenera sp.]|nr:phosphate ABC transporter permease subunit PstC [Methylotenera sp.]
MNTATMTENTTTLTISPRLAKSVRRNIKERVIELILMLAALSAVFTTFAIVAILFYESFGFFKTVSLVEFFTGTEWT